jgi:hypothetical protein
MTTCANCGVYFEQMHTCPTTAEHPTFFRCEKCGVLYVEGTVHICFGFGETQLDRIEKKLDKLLEDCK